MALIYLYEIFLALTCYIVLIIAFNRQPVNWPFVGMMPQLLFHVHNIHEIATEILAKMGGTMLLKGPWFANMDMLCTVNPMDVNYILSSNFPNFPKGPEFIKMFEILGDGIVNSDEDLWKNQRKLQKFHLNHRPFTRFSTKVNENKVREGLIPILEHVAKQDLIVDLQDLFKRYTFDTTCIWLMGYDPMCLSIDLPDVAPSQAMDDAWEAIFFRHIVPKSIWATQKWLGIGKERKLREACETLDHTINKHIAIKRDGLSNGSICAQNEEGTDLLTSYLSENVETELKLTDKFMRDTLLTALLGGRDTTGSALTWFIWLVSTHPKVESKIREEINTVIPSAKAQSYHLFQVEEVNKLVYFHSAIFESLRLFPPVPFEHKEPVKPDILPSGNSVHPKMKILFSLYAMGRMEFVWGNDCMEFKPERWISEQGTIKHEPSYKFMTFNAGPRTCLGKEMALKQMKMVAAGIIHNYDIEVAEGHKVEPNVSIILYMKHGLKVKVSKRWT